MSIITATLAKKTITDQLFTMNINHRKQNTKIELFVSLPSVTTGDLPHTYDMVQTRFPEMLEAQCFNDLHLPFHQEVKNTEIGHLFEHILIGYLCEMKTALGFSDAQFDGLTSWNWKKEKRGTFHISVTAGWEDRRIFPVALEKTIALFKDIICYKNNFSQQKQVIN